MNYEVINGDNINILKNYPDNYFDSVVTDPPYGLGKEPNANELMKDWIEHGYHEIEGKGFMGKEWDAFVPQPIFWKEVFRVLKPGGHVLAFYGTRTYDWGVMAMRFAGFEVRDCIQWLYGSGFPKSHNIGKALDKMEGAEREVIGENPYNKNKGGKNHFSEKCLQAGKLSNITAPSTDAAKRWEGWGTALKPANEPIVLARKPLEKGLSIAENILKWGVGGINIDASRIGFKNDADYKESTQKNQHEDFGTKPLTNNTVYGDYSMVQTKNYQPEGRFPANIILDEIAAEILDEQSGISKGWDKGKQPRPTNHNWTNKEHLSYHINDKGGASRFFYVAKASKSERNKGLDNSNFHPTVKPIKLMQYLVKIITPPNGIVLDPFCGSGTTGVACKLDGFNFVGIEQDQEYTKIAEARIKNTEIEQKQLEIF